MSGTVARLARELQQRCVELTAQIHDLDGESTNSFADQGPQLLDIYGRGTLTATKILGETADVLRFRDKDTFARYSGTALLPIWSGDRQRFRLSRVGKRQLNAALHRIAITRTTTTRLAPTSSDASRPTIPPLKPSEPCADGCPTSSSAHL